MIQNALPGQASILVVLLGSIGDVARALCIVRDIKNSLPDAQISWLVEPKSEALVRLHPDIKQVFLFKRSRGLSGALEVIKELRRQRFDVVLDMQRHLKSGLFARLAGARRSIGFHRRDSKEGNWIFHREHTAESGDTVSKILAYRSFVQALGIPLPDRLDFGLDKLNVNDLAADSLTHFSGPFVGFVLGSSWPSKDWMAQGYSQLASTLLKANPEFEIALLGDSSQTCIADQVCAEVRNSKIINLVGKSDLRTLVGLVKSARVCVGPDSGPGHIAAAVGTPYIGLFGPTSPQRTAPFGQLDLVIQSAVGCAPCNRRICPGLGQVCMRLIRPEVVFQQLQRFLNGLQEATSKSGKIGPPQLSRQIMATKL